MERWVGVEGHEGLEVSSEGRVRVLASLRPGSGRRPQPQRRPERIYSPFRGQNGYLHVAPKFGDKRPKLLVHRLVAKAFVQGYFEGATVNHINGDKLDNRPTNLEWVTLAENTAKQWATGLVDLRGEKHPSSKLTDAQVGAIRQRRLAGDGAAALANEFGISKSLVYKIVTGTKRSPRSS